jgi:hypothetical protein
MIVCDMCSQAKECRQKEINGREYDICADCWRALEEKLKGWGGLRKLGRRFCLPPPSVPEREPEAPNPLPGLPPKIFGGAERAN